MAEENPEIVSYSTFVQDLADSRISDVDIYDYGRTIDLTYETMAGQIRATKGPIGLDGDDLLSHTLKAMEIPHTVHAEKFEGGRDLWEWSMLLSSVAFFLVPVLMLLVILRQSKTIRTLGNALANAANENKAERSGDND